jgi:iron complex outermembrane receptor protein
MTWDINHVNGYQYDFSGDNSKLPLLSYGNADVTNPSAWTLTQLRERPSDVFYTFTNFTSDVEWQATDALKVKGGGEFNKYAFSTDSYRLNSENASGTLLTTPTSTFAQTATLTGLGNLPSGSIRSWAVPNLGAAQALFDIYNRTLFPVTINTNLANNFNVDEKDTSGFLQLDWSTDLFTVPIRGSLGARYVHIDQNSTGWTSVGTGATAASTQTPINHTYNDVLPALNVVAEVTKDFQVRASAAKVMSRADLQSLNGCLGIHQRREQDGDRG